MPKMDPKSLPHNQPKHSPPVLTIHRHQYPVDPGETVINLSNYARSYEHEFVRKMTWDGLLCFRANGERRRNRGLRKNLE